MESKKFRDIIGAYASIYEAKEEPEMEEGEEKEEEEYKGKKKEKKEKEEEGDEEEMEEGFRTIPAGRQREAMMKRASNLTKQAMTPSKDYADIGDGGKGSPREKAGKINDALRDPKLRKEESETDLFDIILEHLVAEGYADTNKAALAIMANMSEEWKQNIVEAKYGTEAGRKKLAKKIRKGEEIGKSGPGTGFKAVEKAAEKGGAEDPKAVAAAAMWKTHGGKKG